MGESVTDRILAELRSMRARLDQIEIQLHSADQSQPAPTPPSQPASDPFQRAAEIKYSEPKKPIPSISYSTPQRVHEASSFGTGGFLGIIGILCFVLAASFFIEMAIDSGWLTPVRQVILAAMFGLSLIVTGFIFRNKDYNYLSMLPGSGIVVLFLTAYATGFIYNLTDQPTTLGLITMVSVFSLVLYFIFEQIYYVLIAAVGAYICPLLMDKAAVGLKEFMVIFLVWDVTFAFLSVRLKRREVNVVASYLALLIFFQQTFFGHSSPDDMALIAYFQLTQFVIFFCALIKHSIDQKDPLNALEAWAFFPLLLLFYELEYIIVNRISDSLAPMLSLAFAGLILGFYHLSKKALPKKNLESGPMVYAFCTIVLYQSIYWEYHASIHSPWVLVLILLSLPYFAKRMEIFKKNIIMVLISFLVVVWEYFKVLTMHHQVGSNGFLEYLLLNLIVCSILAVFYMKSQKESHRQNSDWFILLFFAYVQAMVGLYRLAGAIGEAFALGSGKKFVVSILWGLFAILILSLGKIRKDAFFARTSLFIFAISIGKVFFYDLSNAGSMVRIICLLVLGAVLYFGGYLYRHIETWDKA